MTAITVHNNRTSLWKQFTVHTRCEMKTFWATPGAFIFVVAMPIIAYAIAGFVNRDYGSVSISLGNYHLAARDRYYAAMTVFATFAAAFTSTAIGMGSRRLDGRFRRLRTTAASPVPVMSALLVTWFLVALVTDLLITLMATLLFGVRMNAEQSIRVLLLALLSIIVCMALGFAMSLLFRSSESAIPLSNLVFFPLVLLSGIFYDVNIGDIGGRIIELLPLRAMFSLLGGTFDGSAQPVEIRDILVLLAWAVLSALLVMWRFRWASENEPRRSRVFSRSGATRRATE